MAVQPFASGTKDQSDLSVNLDGVKQALLVGGKLLLNLDAATLYLYTYGIVFGRNVQIV